MDNVGRLPPRAPVQTYLQPDRAEVLLSAGEGPSTPHMKPLLGNVHIGFVV